MVLHDRQHFYVSKTFRGGVMRASAAQTAMTWPLGRRSREQNSFIAEKKQQDTLRSFSETNTRGETSGQRKSGPIAAERSHLAVCIGMVVMIPAYSVGRQTLKNNVCVEANSP